MPGGNLLGDKTIRELAQMLRWWRAQPKTRNQGTSSSSRFAINLPKLVRSVGATAASTSGTFDVYHGTPGSETATGEQITAFNKGSDIANDGWALAHHNSRGWYVADRFGSVDLVVFYLDDQLPKGGSAAATVQEWSGSAWVATGASITVYDVCSAGPARVQSTGVAWLNTESGRYEIIELENAGAFLVDFELEEYLDRNGTADATVDSVAGIEITDAFGFGPARIGRKGIVARIMADDDPENDLYVIFSLDQDRLVRGIAAATISKGDDGNVTLASGDCGSEAGMGITVTACSPYGDVTNGNQVFLNYDTEDDIWVIVAAECP